MAIDRSQRTRGAARSHWLCGNVADTATQDGSDSCLCGGVGHVLRALVAYAPDDGACVVILNNTGMTQDALVASAKKILQGMSGNN
ncbi:MAG TPA: hypothetical protein VGQ93_01235 [Lysobacter sp.]|jgi:hypothetical protein|nr:hypothetical protein [Lysobacter sp.]